MNRKLIRTKGFADYTLNGNYIVVIDGTDYAYFDHKHCDHDLVKKTVNQETGEVRYQYFHKVLEAKILLGPGLILSFAREFIENEKEDVSKQDCELRAAYRLMDKIKKHFPKLPVVIVGDALYCVMPFMKAVREKGWHYILRLKEGRQEKLLDDFCDLVKHMNRSEKINDFIEGEKGTADYVNGVEQVTNKPEICNIAHYAWEDDEGKKCEYHWVTDIEITIKNLPVIVGTGRGRWKIENEGFNTEKNGIYDLEHLCSLNYNAMKNHYLIIQIAHLLMQLYMAYDKIVYSLKEGMRHEAGRLLTSITTHSLNEEDIRFICRKTALHLCCLLTG